MSTTEPVPSPSTTTFPNARLRELRVKIKSLAEEARIIRREERGCGDSRSRCRDQERAARIEQNRCSLREHRTGVVRLESRYSQLAYALLRGRTFRETEPSSLVHRIDRRKLIALVQRFGHSTGVHTELAMQVVDEWLGANSSS